MIPTYSADLFTDAAILEPYEHYRSIRNLGPVVWLDAHNAYAVGRYADARYILAHAELFCSGQGVALNDSMNVSGRGVSIITDGEEHARLRTVTGRPLTPRSLAKLKPEASKLAATLVESLVTRGTFDAVTELAQVMPTMWVPDLLGLPKDGREHLLEWAAAGFDAVGPSNERCHAARGRLAQMGEYAAAAITNGFPPGSMAAGILEAAARGEIRADQCPQSLVDYIAPSIDTTVSALGSAIWLLATHPDQWDLLHREPQRAGQAFEEALRLESPVRGFTRVATTDTEVGGVGLPGGARILVLFASANRDEREWVEPQRFDIARPNAAAHLAFGYGIHVCIGMGLARLEGATILTALAERVRRIELVGPPTRKLNNMLRAFASMPMRITA